MKRLLSLILLLLLTVQVSSCITPDAPSPDGTVKVTDAPTETEPKEPDKEIFLPPWSGADDAAHLFFEDTSTAVVDHSARDYSYFEMEEDLAYFAKAYPNRFSYRSFGKSVAGRELYVATLGNPDAPKQILVSAGIHGREYLTPLLVMKQIEFYLYYYDVGEYNGISYRELFEDCCFVIVPMTNPDGIMLSQAGLGTLSDPALREKVQAVYKDDFSKGYTSQTDIDEYLKYWKANANGVDLNRNFDALWEDYRSGEREPCHKNHKGPAAASEPETRAMVALTESLSSLQAVLCIHSQGEVLYWNCGQEQALLDRTHAFTEAVADRLDYEIIEERNNDASYSDWCALKKDLIAITVETGLGTCPLFIDKFEAIWFDNFDLLPLSALYFHHGS